MKFKIIIKKKILKYADKAHGKFKIDVEIRILHKLNKIWVNREE